MDEEIIDCTICCKPALLAVVLDTIGDDADWHRCYSYAVCERHRNRLEVNLDRLQKGERVTIQQCS